MRTTPDRLLDLETAADRALKELDFAGASRAPAIRQRLHDVAEWVTVSLDADACRRADLTQARHEWGHRPDED